MTGRQKIGAAARYDTLLRCNFACFYCGLPAPIAELHIDHVWPVSKGGTNDPWNLVAACRECNIGKYDTQPSEEIILRARDTWMGFMEIRGLPTYVCQYCERAFVIDEEDDPEEVRAISQCERCNIIMCDAYDAGAGIRRSGACG